MERQPAVYVMASKPNGTLYISVTGDLPKRVWEHKNASIDGFTKRYGVHRLVYYELHADMLSAIAREKQMKKWNRAWKLELIEKTESGLECLMGRDRIAAVWMSGFPLSRE
jgi:putative endonuclease